MISHRIVKIYGLVYFYNDVRDNIQALQMVFDNNEKIIVTCASDGESIQIKDTELNAIDMGDSGKLIIENLSNDSFFCKFINIPLDDCNFIYSKRGRVNMGIHLSFINNKSINILVLGDDLFFYEQIPKEIEIEEELYE